MKRKKKKECYVIHNKNKERVNAGLKERRIKKK